LLGTTAWLVASRQSGIIASLLLGYTVFVGGVVVPTLATFFRGRFQASPTGALWAVMVGGGMAILGKIHGGAMLKAILTRYGQAFLEMVLGPKYLSLLPIVLSGIILLGVSTVTRRPGKGPPGA
jgi:hypothetical protein